MCYEVNQWNPVAKITQAGGVGESKNEVRYDLLEPEPLKLT